MRKSDKKFARKLFKAESIKTCSGETLTPEQAVEMINDGEWKVVEFILPKEAREFWGQDTMSVYF